MVENSVDSDRERGIDSFNISPSILYDKINILLNIAFGFTKSDFFGDSDVGDILILVT